MQLGIFILGNYAHLFLFSCSIIQALSKRIHYGKFVAEAKFQESPEAYMPAIIAQVCVLFCCIICLYHGKQINSMCFLVHYFRYISKLSLLCKRLIIFIWEFQDCDQLMHLLTYETVERAIEHRVEAKAKIFGQEVDLGAEDNGAPPMYKIRPSLVAELYSYRIMPLTKEVQVAYLLRRLD